MPEVVFNGKFNRVRGFALLCGFSSFVFTFIRIRPNRIAPAIDYHSWKVLGTEELLLYIAPLLLIISLEVLNIRRGVKDGVWKALVLILAAVYGFSIHFVVFYRVSLRLLEGSSSYSRASMGFGSWIWLFFCYVIVSTSLKSINSRKIKLLILVIVILVLFILGQAGVFETLGIVAEAKGKLGKFLFELRNHLKLSFTAVFLACIFGIPFGIVAYRRKLLEKPVFFFVNTVQTLPSLALFGLLIAPLAALSRLYPFLRELGIRGIGTWPALIALFLYALLPITRNTYTGLKIISGSVRESASGMGMRRSQIFFLVELPIAVPVVLSGVRISAVQAIGNTAVAALIGAGGFGVFLFQGLGQAAPDLILLGTFPIIFLALVVDNIMDFLVIVSAGRWYRIDKR